jgi:hypothetical protein
MTRGTGETTRQLQAAPRGATFIWVNGDTSYPQALAYALERDDIMIRPISALNPASSWWRGRPIVELILDHAMPYLSDARWATLQAIRSRVAKTEAPQKGDRG